MTKEILLQACRSITQSGKKPSVSSLRTFTNNQYPLKTVIGAITQWHSLSQEQQDSYHPIKEIADIAKPAQSEIETLTQRVHQLEIQIQTMAEKIQMLERKNS
jgi:TolA-binding protein